MKTPISRKQFLKISSGFAAAATFGFPNLILPRRKEKLGVALVGLGRYSNGQLRPGLRITEHCELRGIVTGSPEKIPDWQGEFGFPDKNIYDYENMHQIANNDDIDVVYIVLPNHMHAEYSIIGADAGKHVMCEKPMAMDEAECRAMIAAAEKNRVNLSIGYRMQHEPNTQTIIRYGREETYGRVTGIDAAGAFNGNFPEGDWRTIAAYGGGSLYDMGVYPINAIRYSSGLEPVAVSGVLSTERTEMFPDVDESAVFELELPGGIIGKGECSFARNMNHLDITCTDGWYRLSPFLSYTGVQGETSDGTQLPPNPIHQQARQMDNDALAIKEGRTPLVPGAEGLRDVRIVQAIMKSSRSGGMRIEI